MDYVHRTEKDKPPVMEVVDQSGWKRRSAEVEEWFYTAADDLTGGYEFFPTLWHKRKWNLLAIPITLFAIVVAIIEDPYAWMIPGVYLIYFLNEYANFHKKKLGKHGTTERYKISWPWVNYKDRKVSLASFYVKAYDWEVTGTVQYPFSRTLQVLRDTNEILYEEFKLQPRDEMVDQYKNGEQYFKGRFWFWIKEVWR